MTIENFLEYFVGNFNLREVQVNVKWTERAVFKVWTVK